MSAIPSFIPAQEPTVDPPGAADLFSEYLVISPYGRWHVVQPYQHLANDGSNKIYRSKSLHCYRGDEGWVKGQPLGTNAFYFAFDVPVDLTDMNKISFLLHAYDRHYDNTLWTESILTGDGAVSLQDVNGIAVYSPLFQFATNVKAWNPNIPPTPDTIPHEYLKSQLTGSGSFDWTKVKAITFYVGTKAIPVYDPFPTSGYDIWIDGGPFILLLGTLPMLSIFCRNEAGTPLYNKHMELTDNTSGRIDQYVIPTTKQLSASSYTVKITDSDFLRWSDGATGTKTVSLTAGTTQLSAIFSGGSEYPDGGLDWTTVALIATAIGIGGVALYSFSRGKKK